MKMSKTTALRESAGKIEVYRSGYGYAVSNERGQSIMLPDYWRARICALRMRAELVLRYMGYPREDADVLIEWAMGRGCHTVRDIVTICEDRNAKI